MTLPDGFELGPRRAELEAAAQQAGWTLERDGATIVVRDVWTGNEDHAGWLVATKGRAGAGARDRLGRARRLASAPAAA